MENRVNFTLVGAFVILFTAALMGFIFWLGKYGHEQAKYDHYKIYVLESISGLNIESPVKYKGFEIGRVTDIRINPNNSEQIEISLEINQGTPIKEDTIATVGMLGITGLKYIELLGGSKESKLLKGEGTLKINYDKSLFNKLESSAGDITKKIDRLLSEKNIKSIESILENMDRFSLQLNQSLANMDKLIYKADKALADENIESVSKILVNIESTSRRLNESTAYIDNLLNKELPQTLGEIKKAAIGTNSTFAKLGSQIDQAKIDDLINKKVPETLDAIKEAATNTDAAFVKFGSQLDQGKMDIKGLTKKTLDKMDIIFIELERTLQNLENSVENLRESPSDIIFKSREVEYGPGEKE